MCGFHRPCTIRSRCWCRAKQCQPRNVSHRPVKKDLLARVAISTVSSISSVSAEHRSPGMLGMSLLLHTLVPFPP